MIESTIALIVAISTALGMICDKMRNSRCTHISLCGDCLDIEREPPIVEAKVINPPPIKD